MVPKQVWLISIDKQIVFLEHEYFCLCGFIVTNQMLDASETDWQLHSIFKKSFKI